jgi:hypothetical protein
MSTNINFTERIEKNSSSNSIILKGTFQNKKIYGKIFLSNSQTLLTEKKIYEYIKNMHNNDNSYLEKHIVISPITFIFDIIKILEIVDESIRLHFMCDLLELTNNNVSLLYNINVIVTFDYNMLTLENFISTKQIVDDTYKKTSDDEQIITHSDFVSIIFEILYSISIMHKDLDIMHNDLHFSNILIKKLPKPQLFGYFIENIEYNAQKNFEVKFYDFDLSSKIKHFKQTPEILNEVNKFCKQYGICNRYSQKDVYVILVSLIKNFKNGEINDIIDIISNGKKSLIEAINTNLKEILQIENEHEHKIKNPNSQKLDHIHDLQSEPKIYKPHELVPENLNIEKTEKNIDDLKKKLGSKTIQDINFFEHISNKENATLSADNKNATLSADNKNAPTKITNKEKIDNFSSIIPKKNEDNLLENTNTNPVAEPKLKNTTQKKCIFWSAFCNLNEQEKIFIANECDNTEIPELDIEKVLLRYYYAFYNK